jgi:hypothetical protein
MSDELAKAFNVWNQPEQNWTSSLYWVSTLGRVLVTPIVETKRD